MLAQLGNRGIGPRCKQETRMGVVVHRRDVTRDVGLVADAPENVADVPGNTTNVPGNTANALGNTANVPGKTANVPGNTTNVRTDTTNVPGNTTNVPLDASRIEDELGRDAHGRTRRTRRILRGAGPSQRCPVWRGLQSAPQRVLDSPQRTCSREGARTEVRATRSSRHASGVAGVGPRAITFGASRGELAPNAMLAQRAVTPRPGTRPGSAARFPQTGLRATAGRCRCRRRCRSW
jgi:hypothetical protein